MSERLDYFKAAPDLASKYMAFAQALNQGSLEPALRHLVTLRASQINGCAFCVDMHVKEATLHGERPLRLHHLSVWRESPLYSARERAALAWTELLTQLPPHGVAEDDFRAVREHFSEAEMAELSFAVVAINGWNRLSVGFAVKPGSRDRAFGLDKAGLS